MAFVHPITNSLTRLLALITITQLPNLTANQPIREPSLVDLFTGVEHCDVQIIHSGRHSFNFQHLPFLPTVTFNIKTGPQLPDHVFDVLQVRLPRARIILVLCRYCNGLNPFQWLDANVPGSVVDSKARTTLRYYG